MSVEKKDLKKLDLQFSEALPAWLESNAISLLTSSYQASQILSIGSLNGNAWIRQAPFKKCMGFYERQGALVVSTANSIAYYTRLEGDLNKELFDAETDCVYFPRMSWYTGDLKTHDIVMTKNDDIVFVNTVYDCIATIDPNYSFRPLWNPDFIKPRGRDCCHFNGLGMYRGEPRYLTAIGKSATAGGWREQKREGGLLIDARDGVIINSTLSMPHSPRWYRDRLWLLNSGTGDFGYYDLDGGEFEPITFCPGFARGLAFFHDWAVVGLSNMRRYKAFSGLVLGERLEKAKMDAVCGLLIININTGKIEHWLSLVGAVRELYDVSVLKGSRRPIVIPPGASSTQDVVLLPSGFVDTSTDQ